MSDLCRIGIHITYLALGEANRNHAQVLRLGKKTALDNFAVHDVDTMRFHSKLCA